MKRLVTMLIDQSGGSLDHSVTIFGANGEEIGSGYAHSLEIAIENALIEAKIVNKDY